MLLFCGSVSAQWKYANSFTGQFTSYHSFTVQVDGVGSGSLWISYGATGFYSRLGSYGGPRSFSASSTSERVAVDFGGKSVGYEESIDTSGSAQFVLTNSFSSTFRAADVVADSGILNFELSGTVIRVANESSIFNVSSGATTIFMNTSGEVSFEGDIDPTSSEDSDGGDSSGVSDLVDGLALLISWPLKEALDLGNGIVIPANEGGSPWQYIPIDAFSSDFLAEAFPLGHMATASDGSPLYVAAFGADGNLSVEREVTDFDARFNDITGNLHVSALVNGFVDSVTVNGGSGDNGRQVTDSVAGAASTPGGSTGGSAPGTVSVGITATPTTPAEPDSEDPVVGGSGGSGDGGGGGSLTNITVNSPTTNNNSSTTNTFNINNFESQDGQTEADAFADAAGFDYGDDDGTEIAEGLASSLTDNVRAANDGAKGVLGFLNISTLDPGISPISLDFSIPKTDTRFDWRMDSKLASFIRKIMYMLLVSAFWAGVTRKLMM